MLTKWRPYPLLPNDCLQTKTIHHNTCLQKINGSRVEIPNTLTVSRKKRKRKLLHPPRLCLVHHQNGGYPPQSNTPIIYLQPLLRAVFWRTTLNLGEYPYILPYMLLTAEKNVYLIKKHSSFCWLLRDPRAPGSKLSNPCSTKLITY